MTAPDPPRPPAPIQWVPLASLIVSVVSAIVLLTSNLSGTSAATTATVDALSRRVAFLETQGAGYASCQIENAQLRTEVTGLRRDVEDLKRLIQAHFVTFKSATP